MIQDRFDHSNVTPGPAYDEFLNPLTDDACAVCAGFPDETAAAEYSAWVEDCRRNSEAQMDADNDKRMAAAMPPQKKLFQIYRLDWQQMGYPAPNSHAPGNWVKSIQLGAHTADEAMNLARNYRCGTISLNGTPQGNGGPSLGIMEGDTLKAEEVESWEERRARGVA